MKAFANLFHKIFSRKWTIFIVEDNTVYSLSLQGFLNTRFSKLIIQSFTNGEACMKELHKKPKVIVMDHQLNSHDQNAATGLSMIKKIKAINPKTHIILLSGQHELNVYVEAISVYDCTYVRKDEQAFIKVEQFIRRLAQSSKSSL